MTIVDDAAPSLRYAHAMFVRAQQYQGTSLAMFVRGLRSDDLFAGALQQDKVAVIDTLIFAAAFGATTPKKYDRIVIAGSSYSVQEWRGSPDDGVPVFWKLLIRGGTQ